MALLFALAMPLRTYMSERARLARLQSEMHSLQKQNAQLGRQVARLQDPQELELIARRCLGMVKRGEIAFVVVPRSGKPAPARC